MRKFALLLAAALVVSAPFVAASPTETYAAAKKGKATAKEAKAAPAPVDQNATFGRALTDLFTSFGTPRPEAGSSDKGKGKAKAGKNGGKGKAKTA
jgi:hypothetical protein